MITTTSLKHPTMIAKIKQANYNTILNGYSVDHVTNNQGVPVLAFRYRNKRMAVTDRNGRDLTQAVAKAIFKGVK